MLESVTKGKTEKPPRLLVYGPEGVGKSTFAAGADNPIFVQTEDGLGEIDAAKFPLANTFDEVIAQLTALATEAHEYATVVIDSLDWLERLVWDKLCADYRCTSIEKVDGGWNKGYTHALTYWRQIISKLAVLRDTRNMMVILVAHSKAEKVNDPMASYEYERHAPRLHKHADGLFRDWVDCILFATKKTHVTKNADGKVSAVELGEGERVLLSDGGPAAVSKTRFRGLPGEIPMDYGVFMQCAFGVEPEAPAPEVPAPGATKKKGTK